MFSVCTTHLHRYSKYSNQHSIQGRHVDKLSYSFVFFMMISFSYHVDKLSYDLFVHPTRVGYSYSACKRMQADCIYIERINSSAASITCALEVTAASSHSCASTLICGSPRSVSKRCKSAGVICATGGLLVGRTVSETASVI